MTDQIPEESVRDLLEQALDPDIPAADMLSAALAGSARKRRRTRMAAVGGSVAAVVATVAVAATVAGGAGTGATQSPAAGPRPVPATHDPGSTPPKATPSPAWTTEGGVRLSKTAALPGSASDYVPTTTISPDCKGPWLVKKDPEGSSAGIGPRTQDQASWVCQQILPTVRKVLPGVTLDAETATFVFAGTPGAPPPANGYPATELGNYAVAYNGGHAILTGMISPPGGGLPPGTPGQDAKSYRSRSNTTCVKDGRYIVEIDKAEPEGTAFEVWTPDGTKATLAFSGGTLTADGAPDPGEGFVPIPMTATQLTYFNGNVALVRALEAVLEHFTQK